MMLEELGTPRNQMTDWGIAINSPFPALSNCINLTTSIIWKISNSNFRSATYYCNNMTDEVVTAQHPTI